MKKTSRVLAMMLAQEVDINLPDSGRKILNHERFRTCTIAYEPSKEDPGVIDLSTIMSLSTRVAVVSRNSIIIN